MLVWSKYLKELGYKKTDFPFKEKDGRYKLKKRLGVVEAQTWNLYNTIILELYVYLRYFQDECPKGIPFPYIDEGKKDHGRSKWEKTVQEIVDGLKAYIEFQSHVWTMDNEQEKEELIDKFERAWKLLGENLDCFWW